MFLSQNPVTIRFSRISCLSGILIRGDFDQIQQNIYSNCQKSHRNSVEKSAFPLLMEREISTACGGCDWGCGCMRKRITGVSSIAAEVGSALIDPIDEFSDVQLGCDAGDIFYGTDDLDAMRDFMYKEDVIENYRREAAMKSLRKRTRGYLSSGLRCFEFLKLLCCIRFSK